MIRESMGQNDGRPVASPLVVHLDGTGLNEPRCPIHHVTLLCVRQSRGRPHYVPCPAGASCANTQVRACVIAQSVCAAS